MPADALVQRHQRLFALIRAAVRPSMAPDQTDYCPLEDLLHGRSSYVFLAHQSSAPVAELISSLACPSADRRSCWQTSWSCSHYERRPMASSLHNPSISLDRAGNGAEPGTNQVLINRGLSPEAPPRRKIVSGAHAMLYPSSSTQNPSTHGSSSGRIRKAWIFIRISTTNATRNRY